MVNYDQHSAPLIDTPVKTLIKTNIGKLARNAFRHILKMSTKPFLVFTEDVPKMKKKRLQRKYLVDMVEISASSWQQQLKNNTNSNNYHSYSQEHLWLQKMSNL